MTNILYVEGENYGGIRKKPTSLPMPVKLEYPHRTSLLKDWKLDVGAGTVNAMRVWLTENVKRDGKSDFMWDGESLVEKPGDLLYGKNLYIRFKYESDLLAFRLRWGV